MDNPKINLKEIRENKGISERQLSKITGISQGYISDLESGKKSPTVRMLYRIANALEICPHYLLPVTIYCSNACKKWSDIS
ncbi:helix-turn-helix transcriptional regulator [Clostridium botulinum]|uniref:Helix-turn-helix transcriptional regulator n=1 Tax=Clostridium botulinum TaxID=1491 RepID=A0A846JTH8_CLOBO|nr:helix-turn-helix transcriptional regulator [Clostridium botulinum]KOM89544.1 DNA-binding protein [Clostridium botulinum]KOR61212.1 DNA-binding protein [Clostridium botulinum]NFE13330.1 helix-turn-helix transcriptional regulator [Clostridium botulinum]NFE82842.1 helix-turn-helix transcriptional regulator [Clostridium botulinum]NFG37078.1 helix-turn-helix transcriptional regulator [Clostridium botulinum]